MMLTRMTTEAALMRTGATMQIERAPRVPIETESIRQEIAIVRVAPTEMAEFGDTGFTESK